MRAVLDQRPAARPTATIRKAAGFAAGIRRRGVLAGALRRARLAGSGLARRPRASTPRPWTRAARRPPPPVSSAFGREASSSNPQLVRPRPLYTAADKRPALAYKGRPCRSRPPTKRRHEVARELARQGLAFSAWP